MTHKPTTPSQTLTGGCLCGSVRYTVVAPPRVHVCHCKMCRRWSGGPSLALANAESLTIEGEANLAVYASSAWGERCFCRVCGSNLLWRSPKLGMTSVMAGSLDDESALTITSQIYVDSKPPYYDFANQTSMKTEADIVARINPPA